MKSDWTIMRAEDFIQFNPKLHIKKGQTATKVSMDKLRPFTKKIPDTEDAEYEGGSKFCNGDTIMARITPCLENGKTAFVDVLDDGEIAFGSTEFIVMRAKEGISDPQFVYYLATSPAFRKVAIKSMVGTTGRQRVQQGVLSEMELLVPPLEEQQRIGGFLSKLDEKIALNEKINDNLTFQAQALFKSWFIDCEPFELESSTGTGSPNLPVGWKQCKLAEVTTNIRTRVKDRQCKVLSAVNSGSLQLSEDYFTKQVFSKDISGYILVEENDFAYNPSRVNIGSIGINDLGIVGCVSPVYVVFRTEPDYQYFFDFFIKSSRFKEEVKARASGSVRQAMNYNDFGLITVSYPPIEIIKQFNKLYLPIKRHVDHLKKESQKLRDIRDALLPRLMSGEIDVSDLEH